MTQCPYIEGKTCELYHNQNLQDYQALTPAYLKDVCHKDSQKCQLYRNLVGLVPQSSSNKNL